MDKETQEQLYDFQKHIWYVVEKYIKKGVNPHLINSAVVSIGLALLKLYPPDQQMKVLEEMGFGKDNSFAPIRDLEVFDDKVGTGTSGGSDVSLGVC